MRSAATAIKKIRYSMGLGQKELGELLGVSQQAVYNYESGNRRPTLSVLKKIKKVALDNDIEFNIDDFLS